MTSPSQRQEPSNTYKMAQVALSDSRRWFAGTADSLAVTALGLCGESGEFADEIKKWMRGSQDIADERVRYKMVMELADIYTYLLVASAQLKVDLEKAYEQKRAVNEQRFGKR